MTTPWLQPLRRPLSLLAALACAALVSLAPLVAIGAHVYYDRTDLPDLEPFVRFEFPTIGRANAYRTMASGVLAQPHVIRAVAHGPGPPVDRQAGQPRAAAITDEALALIQEGMRGVVRLPGGTAHALDSGSFPIAVMGKTGTTNEFRDALFAGSTYGPGGITVAVRIGFDDNRPLGSGETGGRVALPIFREVMLRVYRDQLLGPAPSFPRALEERITRYLASVPTPSLLVNPEVVPTVSAGIESMWVDAGGRGP